MGLLVSTLPSIQFGNAGAGTAAAPAQPAAPAAAAAGSASSGGETSTDTSAGSEAPPVGVTGGTPQPETTRSGPVTVSVVLLKLFVSSDSRIAFWSSASGPKTGGLRSGTYGAT